MRGLPETHGSSRVRVSALLFEETLRVGERPQGFTLRGGPRTGKSSYLRSLATRLQIQAECELWNHAIFLEVIVREAREGRRLSKLPIVLLDDLQPALRTGDHWHAWEEFVHLRHLRSLPLVCATEWHQERFAHQHPEATWSRLVELAPWQNLDDR